MEEWTLKVKLINNKKVELKVNSDASVSTLWDQLKSLPECKGLAMPGSESSLILLNLSTMRSLSSGVKSLKEYGISGDCALEVIPRPVSACCGSKSTKCDK